MIEWHVPITMTGAGEMENPLGEHLAAAIRQIGFVVNEDKALILAQAVAGKFHLVIDPSGRLVLESRGGKPVDQELERLLERPEHLCLLLERPEQLFRSGIHQKGHEH